MKRLSPITLSEYDEEYEGCLILRYKINFLLEKGRGRDIWATNRWLLEGGHEEAASRLSNVHLSMLEGDMLYPQELDIFLSMALSTSKHWRR